MNCYAASTVLLTGILSLACAGAPAKTGPDPVLEAKRKAAAQMIKDGQLADAAILLGEVVKVDATRYEDFYTLATVYDKLGNQAEAITAYRKVRSLTSENARDLAEKKARAETDKRLKTLDAVSDKIDQALQRMLKEIDTLGREAETAKNSLAVTRLQKLRVALLQADGWTASSISSKLDWQPSGLSVVQGKRYRVQALGTWFIGTHESTADGISDRPQNEFGRIGQLLGCIDMKSNTILQLGSSGVFTAPATGTLYFGPNCGPKKTENSGNLLVIVAPE